MKKVNQDNSVVLNKTWDFTKDVFKDTCSTVFSINTWKKLYKSKYEKWVFVVSLPMIDYFIIFKVDNFCKDDIPDWTYLSAPVVYYMGKSICKTAKQNCISVKYKGFSKEFNDKAKIINVVKDKKSGITTYTIYCFVPRTKIMNSKDDLEHYFNSNILDIKIDKYNKRLFTILTSKNKISKKLDNSSIENRLINVLNDFGFNAKFKSKFENDFFESIDVDCIADTKKIFNKIDDIAYKLKIDNSRLSIDVDKGVFVFQIKKEHQNTYYFVDYVDKVKIDTKMILPVMYGIHQDSNNCIIGDIYDDKHVLIMGQNGSGKSSTLNSFIQSSMYFHGSIYSKYIMYDEKKTELSQYKNFINTTYITTTEQLLNAINELEKIEVERGKLFDKVGVKELKKYNAKFPNKKLPYIYLVIDEFSVMMKRLSQKDSSMAKEINDKLVNLGLIVRYAGIRLVISTQKPTGSQIDTDIVSQLQVKMIHKITKSDKKVLMIEEDVHKLKTGEFILETENYTTKMKGLFIDDEKQEYNKIYELLKQKYSVQGGEKCY